MPGHWSMEARSSAKASTPTATSLCFVSSKLVDPQSTSHFEAVLLVELPDV